MTIHVVIQPADGYVAEVLEPSPGVCQLIAGSDEAGLTVQVPARVGGLSDAAKFARVLFAAKVQSVPPSAIPGVPLTPVVLEGLTVQPRAEASGQARWINWVVRATGMQAVDARAGRSAKAATPGDAKAA